MDRQKMKTIRISGLLFPLLALVSIIWLVSTSIAAETAPEETKDLEKQVISPLSDSSKASSEKSAPVDEATPMEPAQGIAPESAQPQDANQKDNPEQASYPGVQNILYRSGGDNEPHAVIWYPAFGNEYVDSDLKYFVSVQGADFSKDIEDSLPEGEEKPATYDQWEMTGFYTLSRPSPDIVSITFNIYSYSGGAHGNLFIRCLNYNLATSKPLELANLFGDTEKALEIMSVYCDEKLRKELGSDLDEDMLRSGTTPEANNFFNLSLVKDGVVVEFQPYQVGPWSIGPQSVPIPLSVLAPAKPAPAVWPDETKAAQSTE